MANVKTGSFFKKIIDKMTGETKEKVPVLLRTSSKVVFREDGSDMETNMNSVDSKLKELEKTKFKIENGCLVVTCEDGK